VIAVFLLVLAILWLVAGLATWRLRPTRGLHLDLLATGLYLPAVLGFFWQLILLPDIVVPRGGGDLASFLYPVYSFAAQQWQQGVIPFWNPHLYGGSPFLADMQTATFYPPNLLAFILVRPFNYEALELLAVIHYLLAAVFAYVFGRTLGLGRLGSYAAGLIFAFSGFLVVHLGHLNMIEATVWLPLVLACLHQAIQPGDTRRTQLWTMASGVALGMSFLAGHNQISLYIVFFMGLYWIWGLLSSRQPGAPFTVLGIYRAGILALPMTGAVALGVAAAQLLPTSELLPLTVRASLTYRQAGEFASEPANLITLIVPHFFGSNPAAFWGITGNLTEVYAYAGVSSLALALVGIILGRRGSPWVPFLGLTALLFLLLSFGEHTILHGWLYRFVPGFDKVRSAGRFVLFFDFGVAVLAGFGLQALLGPLAARSRPAWRWLSRGLGLLLAAGALVGLPLLYHALLVSLDKDPGVVRAVQEALHSLVLAVLFLGLALGLLLVWRYMPRYRAWLWPMALALVFVDLYSANAGYNPTTENILSNYRHPEIIQYLRQEATHYRIDTQTNVGDVWQPNLPLLEGIDDVMGIYNPMLLADYQAYWMNLPSRSASAYNVLNARFVIGHKNVPLDMAKFELAFDGDENLNVYRNRQALPRAFLAGTTEVLPREAILARLKAPDFDPRQVILLEIGEAMAGQDAPGEVTAIRQPNVNETVVELQASRPTYLFLSETWYPGWKVYVDGVEKPLLRANYTFRAVKVEAGSHTVRFAFQPRSWTLGLFLAAATLAIIALTLISSRPKPQSP
jgi:hypothetical protein